MSGYVYVARSGVRTKVGYSATPLRRFKALRLEHPELEFIGCFPGDESDERRIHELLGNPVMGREWFECSDDALRLALEGKKLMPVPDKGRMVLAVTLPYDLHAELRRVVSGKGMRMNFAIQQAVEAWLKAHPKKRAA